MPSLHQTDEDSTQTVFNTPGSSHFVALSYPEGTTHTQLELWSKQDTNTAKTMYHHRHPLPSPNGKINGPGTQMMQSAGKPVGTEKRTGRWKMTYFSKGS